MFETQNSIEEEKIRLVKEKTTRIREELQKRITGMEHPVDALIASILVNGHVLLEGMPGLAKTMLAKSIAEALDSPFQRIQFTPDLLPADLTGTTVFNPKTAEFDIRKGPVFSGVLLADEINRAPAKVQSALLQCMEERQVSIGDHTFSLDSHFFVMATQNPIDQEGTYQLPEAQMDRFLMKVKVGYPSEAEEVAILDQHGTGDRSWIRENNQENRLSTILDSSEREEITKIVESVFIDPKLKEYIIRIVRESRPETAKLRETPMFIRHGASPRASLALLKLAKAKSLLDGRDFVIPEDIRYFAREILRHRILLKFEAIAEDIDPDIMIESILENVRVP